MAFSRVYTGTIVGLDYHPVTVEVNLDKRGFPGFKIVGLAAKEVSEAKERVRSAIKNSGFKFPFGKITVSLSPADLPKNGSLYDLPIAIGILIVSGAIREECIDKYIFAGELALNGKLNPLNFGIHLALMAEELSKDLIIGGFDESGVSLTKYKSIYRGESLDAIVMHLNGFAKLVSISLGESGKGFNQRFDRNYSISIDDIKGMDSAKRAISLAVAGGHHIAMLGPPGSGKTMLARSVQSILPQLNESELIENTRIYSVLESKSLDYRNLFHSPFVEPHSSITKSALIGGGIPLAPGEISLANNGVLFLDEILNFKWDLINLLRTPIEDKVITIKRKNHSYKFPAKFLLIAASNLCLCGNLGNPRKACICSPSQINIYKQKLASPIFDRIDMCILCSPIDYAGFSNDIQRIDNRQKLILKIDAVRKIQSERYKKYRDINLNGSIPTNMLDIFCSIDKADKMRLIQKISKLALSNRIYLKIVKVSRTIADFDNSERIKMKHIDEAIQYRVNLEVQTR